MKKSLITIFIAIFILSVFVPPHQYEVFAKTSHTKKKVVPTKKFQRSQ